MLEGREVVSLGKFEGAHALRTAAQGAAVRYRDAAELKAYTAAERQRWTAVIKEAGITVD